MTATLINSLVSGAQLLREYTPYLLCPSNKVRTTWLSDSAHHTASGNLSPLPEIRGNLMWPPWHPPQWASQTHSSQPRALQATLKVISRSPLATRAFPPGWEGSTEWPPAMYHLARVPRSTHSIRNKH